MPKPTNSPAPSLFTTESSDSVIDTQPVTAQPSQAAPQSRQEAKYPTEMHQTALVFLDDQVARRLAVAWATCGGDEAAWFETAGFGPGDQAARRMSKALRANGICRDGGVTDKLALQYIHAVIARPLKSGRAKPRTENA